MWSLYPGPLCTLGVDLSPSAQWDQPYWRLSYHSATGACPICFSHTAARPRLDWKRQGLALGAPTQDPESLLL